LSHREVCPADNLSSGGSARRRASGNRKMV
jgi:hypothetical protein